ncbi:hypothetical protein K6R49_003725 [Escherichia coli]|uniref:phage baseplate plug family protein n=1 Tax=Buttiauxella noackiae TaxID=82992 RepID=UPI0019DACC82|nr:hypothetical protein [Escherichia coli]MBJ0329693.1 hypothetical protein [Escherichia coli]
MAYSINVPDNEWSSQTVTLGEVSLIVEFRYQTRTGRWYLTLSSPITGEIYLSQRKLVGNMLTTAFTSIPGFTGELFCEHVYGNLSDKDNSYGIYPTRNNFGRGKEFELKYLTNDELVAIQLVTEVSS